MEKITSILHIFPIFESDTRKGTSLKIFPFNSTKVARKRKKNDKRGVK